MKFVKHRKGNIYFFKINLKKIKIKMRIDRDLIIWANNEEQSWYKAAVCDLTRLPVGDLLVLAVAGDDKFVLFRGSTLKKRDGTESVTPTSRRAKKKAFQKRCFQTNLGLRPLRAGRCLSHALPQILFLHHVSGLHVLRQTQQLASF